MSMTYTLTACSPLGDFDDKYGQRHWGEALETGKPVSFNSMTVVPAGSRITFETMAEKTSKKGTEYVQLYKVKVIGHIDPAQAQIEPTEAPESLKEALERIYTALEELKEMVSDFFGEGKRAPYEAEQTDDGLIDVSDPKEKFPEIADSDIPEEEPVDISDVPF